MDKALIIGLGEVGMALVEVLAQVHQVYIKDNGQEFNLGNRYGGPDNGDRFDFMHVCFPYGETFICDVGVYQQQYDIGVTVVHSTVPIGTCRELGAVHSPVIGLHPKLAESLETFTKFCGGPGAGKVAQHLGRAGIKCYVTDKAETTELVKLLSTTFYGLCIEWTKHIKEECDKQRVPFEAWTLWTQAYNEGYQALNRTEYTRPILIPMDGRIGGHCVLPNLALMPEDDPFVGLIRERNE